MVDNSQRESLRANSLLNKSPMHTPPRIGGVLKNALRRSGDAEGKTPDRNPIRGIFVGCCAWPKCAGNTNPTASKQTPIALFISSNKKARLGMPSARDQGCYQTNCSRTITKLCPYVTAEFFYQSNSHPRPLTMPVKIIGNSHAMDMVHLRKKTPAKFHEKSKGKIVPSELRTTGREPI
jgi:hypothetical protein